MTTTTTTTIPTPIPRTWWKWDQVPKGVLVYHLDDGSACPACGGALRLTYEECDVGGNPIARDLECSACAWGQGCDVHGFVWARRP